MKRSLWPVLIFVLLFMTGIVSAQNAEPTQTPYIIYVVVTATPEPPAADIPAEDEALIHRPTAEAPISLVNGDGAAAGASADPIAITNPTTGLNGYATTTDELVQMVVSTVVAQANTAAGGSENVQNGSAGGAVVRNTDGTTCTMNFELVSEPTYPAGSIIPRGQTFWKEWVILNTGTCTWTPEWEFVFDSGWQIGNTRFHMNRTTPPGQTLNVRLGMIPDQKQNGNYYSTYIFEAPDGTRYGTITSSYTVKDISYFRPTPEPQKTKPKHGKPVGPGPEPWPWPGPGPFPPPPPPWEP